MNLKPAVRLLDDIMGYSHRRRPQVWDDMLDVTEATLRMMPVHLASLRTTGKMAEDDDEARELWARLHPHYDADNWQRIAELQGILFDLARSFGAIVYEDYIAKLYEDWAGAERGLGQFFTPWEVCVAMARITCDGLEDLLRRRIVSAVGAGVIEVLGLNPSLPHTLTYIAQTLLPHRMAAFEPVTVLDPACGSGSGLLAVASVAPQWAVELGLIRFQGQDIDHTAVQMARVNMMLRGLNGYGLRLAHAAATPIPTTADITIEAGRTNLFGDAIDRAA